MATSKERFSQGLQPQSAGWKNNFRVPPVPKVSESISGRQLVGGLQAHDTAMEQWRQVLEKSIEDRITATATATTAATAVKSAPAAAAPVDQTSAPAPVTPLTSDSVPQGLTNLYMTVGGWSNIYDQVGYGRNYIGPSENITIPGQRNAVIAGPLVIEGVLTIDGILAMIKI